LNQLRKSVTKEEKRSESNVATDIHGSLIEKCKAGDRRAQEELYHLYARSMLGVSMRILNDKQEAEDVLQECFVSAFSKLHSYRGTASFGSWLRRIVINKSINQLKKRKVRFDTLNEEMEKVDAVTTEEIPRYTVEDVRWAVRGLPDGYRLVFTLFMFEDMSHASIAKQLNITESTSKSQLNRAKKRIRNMIIKGR